MQKAWEGLPPCRQLLMATLQACNSETVTNVNKISRRGQGVEVLADKLRPHGRYKKLQNTDIRRRHQTPKAMKVDNRRRPGHHQRLIVDRTDDEVDDGGECERTLKHPIAYVYFLVSRTRPES